MAFPGPTDKGNHKLQRLRRIMGEVGVIVRWQEVGLELLGSKAVVALEVIKANYPNDVEKCCTEMFKKWLECKPDADWDQLASALTNVGLTTAAESIKSMEQITVSSSENGKMNDKEVNCIEKQLNARLLAKLKGKYAIIIKNLCDIIKRNKLDVNSQIMKLCSLDDDKTTIFSTDGAFKIIHSVADLFFHIGKYCTMFDYELLTSYVESTECEEAIKLLDDFTKELHSSVLSDLDLLCDDVGLRDPKDFMSGTHKLVIKYVGGKCTLKIEEMVRNIVYEHFRLKAASITFKGVTEGCVAFVYQISPTVKSYLEQHCSAARKIFSDSNIKSLIIDDEELKLPVQLIKATENDNSETLDFTKFEDVSFPLHDLQNLHKEHWWISSSTLLIGYYHNLLVRDINADILMDKMCSSGLLAHLEQEMILTGHSMHQRNWILLEHVRHMELQSLVKFCEFVQETSQVGAQLKAGLDFDVTTDVRPQSYIPDEQSLVLKNEPMAYNSPSSLHILFLDVIDQVKDLLQFCDTRLLIESCENLMASETHGTNLFSDSYITKLNNHTSVTSLVGHLSFLFTWSDHSILRALASCNNEAVQLLDEFDSFLDPLNTVVSYPIDEFSLPMTPCEDSPYTLLAIRCNIKLWQCPLQYVFNIRSTLIELCDITQHCLRLSAIQSDPTIIYWNIPKHVIELIEAGLAGHVEYLSSQGIVEVIAYPNKLLLTGDDVVFGSLAFQIKQEIDTKDEKETSTDALSKSVGTTSIDYFLRELNKSKRSAKNFQETAEKANEQYEKLLEEYNKLKESTTQRDSTSKLEKLQQDFSDFNLKLEKNFKQMVPNYELVIGACEAKDPIQQLEYNLEKSMKYFGDFQSQYSKQQQIQLQQSQEIHNLKSTIELKAVEANKNISYLKSELNENKHLIEKLQETAVKAKERDKEMLTTQRDSMSKLEKLQQNFSDFNLKLEENFKQMVPNYELVIRACEAKDPIEQMEYNLEKSMKYFSDFQLQYSKQQQIQLQQSQEICNLKSTIELKAVEANKNISYLKSELNERENSIEKLQETAAKAKERDKEMLLEDSEKLRETIWKDVATKIVNKLSDYNLEIENKFKQTLPDKDPQVMEPHIEKEQLEHKLENHLKRLINNVDHIKQEVLQLQNELQNKESELEVKTSNANKLKEENKMLLKRIRENKATSFVQATDKPDNINYPVRYGQLGSGLFGEVHKVRYKNSAYAGKVIHNKVLSMHPEITNISMLELQKLSEIKYNFRAENLSHPNVEQFFEITLSSGDDGVPVIVTELLAESLTVFVERCRETLPVDQEIYLCNDMAQGIAYLHSYSLVHGNLHGNNVLMTKDGHAKIGDYLCPILFDNVDVDDLSGYLPPEIFQNKTTLSKQSNIYTLGVLFLQVITKQTPQPRTRDSTYLETEHKLPSHHPLVSLIQKCLESKEIRRPLVTDVCGELTQLIKQKDSPQRMAYKLLYTAEHKPLVATLTSGGQQKLQHLLCENMPARMYWGCAVVINKTEVYVTGGNSHSGTAIENVYKFSMLLNQWDKLPSTGLHHSIPTILKNKLTLFGGRRSSDKTVVNTVVTYDNDAGWIPEYPDMTLPRYRPAVVTSGDHVIVMGGRIKYRSTITDSIEVMNVEEKKWVKLATCLPRKMFDLEATVSRDCLWIVGYDDGSNRSNRVCSIAVKDLLSNPTVKHSFKTIRHDTLYYKMSIIPNSDPLVLLGGDNWRNKPTSAVVVFDHKTESWNEVASLSGPRAYCAVATVGQCGLLVIGGCTETKTEKASNSTCLQTTELYYI